MVTRESSAGSFFFWVKVCPVPSGEDETFEGVGRAGVNFHWEWITRPPCLLAGAMDKEVKIIPCLRLDSDYPGIPSSSVQYRYHAAGPDRSRAVSWLQQVGVGGGQEWLSGALEYFLFEVELHTDVDEAKGIVAVADDTPGDWTPPERDDNCPGYGTDWIKSVEPYSPLYLNLGSDLSILKELKDQLAALLPGYHGSLRECEALNSIANRWNDSRQQILVQSASLWRAVSPVIKVTDVDDLQRAGLHATLHMLGEALRDMDALLLLFKAFFNRGRPWSVVGGNVHRLIKDPGHPSFPSGHAAQAALVAILLKELFSKLYGMTWDDGEFDAKAGEVAKNREIAGVHFASDSKAGKAVAAWCANRLLGNSTFTTLMDGARAECKQYFKFW
ncbi:MAG TPA: hypothetical protein VLA61_25100 [Ideonella sp.]|uniref:hypothetical protein n=1 Tax=Ideonella sp. TaxID=1929293 RepID=UPI002C0CD70E|nr:hypothetical protein [Ideonella sp.]HSI51560.1 hypothetical protein [Ideonella sp.]